MQLPCYTGSTPECDCSINHGGGVFFSNDNFYIYTKKDFMEFRENFTGKTNDDIYNKTKGQIIGLYGKPLIEVQGSILYTTDYGCLILHFNSFRVSGIEIYSRNSCLSIYDKFQQYSKRKSVRIRMKNVDKVILSDEQVKQIKNMLNKIE